MTTLSHTQELSSGWDSNSPELVAVSFPDHAGLKTKSNVIWLNVRLIAVGGAEIAVALIT